MDNVWDKVLLSVFKKSQFLSTVVIDRKDLSDGFDLLGSLDKWSTKVLVKRVSDVGLETSQFDLIPGEKAEIREFQLGEYSWQNGWSSMYFRLDGHKRPFLVVSVVTAWFDTYFYSTFDIVPDELEAGADISAKLKNDEREAFPDLKARYVDGQKIEIDFEGEKQIFDATKHEMYHTPSRKTSSSTVTIYDDDHSIDSNASIRIEIIPAP